MVARDPAKTLPSSLSREDQIPDMSPAERTLLLVVKNGIYGVRIEELTVFSDLPDVDWTGLLKLAFENRVAALLSYSIAPLFKVGIVPEREQVTLKKFFLETVQRNLKIRSSLTKILKAFEVEGIKVVPLKGAALASSLWPSLGTRQMHDIDIVVERSEVFRAIDVLHRLGFERIGGHSIEWHLEHTKEFTPFVDPAIGIEVELHYRFFTPNPILKLEEKPFWDDARSCKIDGASCLSLAPEHLLVYLSLHVSVWHFLEDNLRSQIDIALAFRKYRNGVCPEKLDAYLNDLHVGPLVAFPFYVCSRFLDVSFEPIITDSENLLKRHYSGFKLRVLESVAKRFVLKLKPDGIVDLLLSRLAKKIIYEPKVGLFGLLSCFILPEDDVRRFLPKKSTKEKVFGTVVRRAKLVGGLVGLPDRRKN